MATGDAAYANKITDYDIQLTVKLKGANIKGSFDINRVDAWLNSPGNFTTA